MQLQFQLWVADKSPTMYGHHLQVMARNRILLTPSEVGDGGSVHLAAHDSRAKHILQVCTDSILVLVP